MKMCGKYLVSPAEHEVAIVLRRGIILILDTLCLNTAKFLDGLRRVSKT